MYDIIIKNGKVVSASTVECDVAIKDGKIQALGNFDDEQADRVIDAKDKYVLPGTIEAHMHCQAPFQGCLGANTFFEQSVSAAFGGVTTFMDFANMAKGDSPYKQVIARKEEMAESAIDYSVHGKFVESTEESIADIPKMAKAGFPTFKMFMTYRKEGVMSDDDTLLKVFKKAKEVNGLPMLHCESNPIAESNNDKFAKLGELTWKNFALSKPVLCEAEAFARATYFARYVNAPILVVHTTNKEALDVARKAHANKFPLYVEKDPII